MKWWRDKPWNDAPARCDVRRQPQVMMGEVTEADFESAPICRLRLGHKGGHDYTAPPGPGCYRAAASDADGTQDEYRAAAEDYRVALVGSCDVSPDLGSQWRNGTHYHVVWPDGDHWCYETREGATERRAELLDLAAEAASCGDPECPEEHGDEDAPVDTYSDYFHRSNFGGDVPLAPWGGPAPQPKLAARRGLARAWFVRAVIVVLAVVLVLLLGWVR